MVDVAFGTYGSGTRNTSDQPVYSNSIGMPTGRACSDGINRAGITALFAYADGYSGTISMRLELGSAVTADFANSGGGPTAGNTGWRGTNLWIISGGATQFRIYFSGRVQFGGGGSGSGIFDGVGYSWSGTLAGAYRYIMPPTAPTITSAVPSSNGTQIVMTLGGNPDNGGSAITGHVVQRATNAAFTTGVATLSYTGTTVGMSGLTPGTRYYYRATARNLLTNSSGVLGGAWSPTVSVVQTSDGGLGRRYSGSSFAAADAKRWNGSAWQPADGRRWSGTSWTQIGQ